MPLNTPDKHDGIHTARVIQSTGSWYDIQGVNGSYTRSKITW